MRWYCVGLAWLLLFVDAPTHSRAAAEVDGGRYLEAARRFADAVLKHGRDAYGTQHTPLFVDGLHAETLEPVRWQCRGQSWVLCNFASQQPLLRTLDGLTALSGNPEYREAAEDAARHTLVHLSGANGLLYWGGHMAWDLAGEKPVGQYGDVHELKGHQPYFRLMWRVNPDATKELMRAIWAGHIVDWSLLDYNRHASLKKRDSHLWAHAFQDDVEVPFPAKGNNLSFVNVSPPLLHSGAMLAVLNKDDDALTWTRRLIRRWQQGKDESTGLCGGQLSYRKHDRAQDALGHVHPTINEAKIVASYHQTCRYHQLPLAQMQAGESLIAAGGRCAAVGRELIQWAADDLKVYAKFSYAPDKGGFVALMTDGTPIKWREARPGYYVASSFAPRRPDSLILWGYALAYRLTRDEQHWSMTRDLAQALGLGDIGAPNGQRSPRWDTNNDDWRVIYALLELHGATGDEPFLRLAGRVGDNIMQQQAKSGLFPRRGRSFARTGDEAPLALLHLAAALNGEGSKIPPPIYDSRFFHCEFHGQLDKHQQKRADSRTYDHLVFYGDR
jgi:pectate lyase